MEFYRVFEVSRKKQKQTSIRNSACGEMPARIIGKDKKAQCAMKNKMKNKESQHLTPMLRVWRGNQARKGRGKWVKQSKKNKKTWGIRAGQRCITRARKNRMLPSASCWLYSKKGISLGWSHEKSGLSISCEKSQKENNPQVAGKRRWCSVIKMDRESYFSLFL